MKTELNFSFKFGIFAAVVAAFIALAPETSAGFFDGVMNLFASSDTKKEPSPEAQFTKPLMEEAAPAEQSALVRAPEARLAEAHAAELPKSEDAEKIEAVVEAAVKETTEEETVEEAAVEEEPENKITPAETVKEAPVEEAAA